MRLISPDAAFAFYIEVAVLSEISRNRTNNRYGSGDGRPSILDEEDVIGNVGAGRAYLFRRDGFVQITQDHAQQCQ